MVNRLDSRCSFLRHPHASTGQLPSKPRKPTAKWHYGPTCQSAEGPSPLPVPAFGQSPGCSRPPATSTWVGHRLQPTLHLHHSTGVDRRLWIEQSVLACHSGGGEVADSGNAAMTGQPGRQPTGRPGSGIGWPGLRWRPRSSGWPSASSWGSGRSVGRSRGSSGSRSPGQAELRLHEPGGYSVY